MSATRAVWCASSRNETKGVGMPETEQLPEEEDVEAHRFVKPPAGAGLDPPDPSQADDDEDVEAHRFVKPPAGAGLDPPDPS
jgi:hypothetical protein